MSTFARLIGIVTAADRAQADADLSAATGADQTGTFCAQLSADGTAPATHYACSAQFDADVFPIDLFLALVGMNGRQAWRGVALGVDDPAGVVVDVGDALPADITTARYTFERALSDTGLVRVAFVMGGGS